MSNLKLSFASALNERTRPLMDGTVGPEGIELVPIVSHPAETFWRQLRFMEFDVCEMSLSSLLIAQSRGIDLQAIPVFPSRRFFQLELDCHADAGIEQPSDLTGMRIGVGEYQQTAALWLRAILEHDFGVSQYDVHWYMERPEELSHGGATGFVPPPGISFQRIPPEESLATMLVSHRLDAAMVRPSMRTERSNLLERSQRMRGAGDWNAVRRVFPDGIAEGRRFFAAHGYIPVNHTYVVRGELLRAHPWIAISLYTAFSKARRLAEERLYESIPLSLVFRWEYLDITREAVGDDPFPYGLEANRTALEDLVAHSHEQGLIPEPVAIEDIFAPSTHDLGSTKEPTRTG
jgi:4,5-dihydroxyphthalate decarboxylase